MKTMAMGYRKIKPRLIHLDYLASECGLFSGELANGYGCKSRSKTKTELHHCFDFDCPLAYSASLADIKKHDKEQYEECLQYLKEDCSGYYESQKGNEEDLMPRFYGDHWMIQYREKI